ncbi:alpha/beta fold hydrolase [Nocardioides sp. L-11A]|uniref:alpha/beta fold hydrolase n=1 Tax=Nocardioides sp. L-11A TaxID=3043848 RepID=UPI00249A62F0|nr:alpha/beta hydrolase [Nocardioides sp. L-11A]
MPFDLPASTPTPSAVLDARPDWFARALAHRPEAAECAVDGVRIRLRAWGRAGAAEGVLLVHGGGAHAGWWDHVAPLLADGGRRVVALDLSGHGDSGHRVRYELDDWAAEVAAGVATGGFGGPPVVVGHSMGGLVALRHGLRHGRAVRGTILVDCRTVPYSDAERAANEERALRPAPVYPDPADALARFRLIPDQRAVPYVFEHVAATSIRRTPAGWSWKFDPRIFAGQRDFDPLDLGRLAGRLRMVRAEHGMPAADLSRLDPAVRSVPTVEIPDAGHHVMLDRPLTLVATLRALLATW